MLSRNSASLLVALLLSLMVFVVGGCSGQSATERVDDEILALTTDELLDSVTTQVSVFYPVSDTVVQERITLDDESGALLQVLQRMFETRTLSSGETVTLPRAEVLGVHVQDGLATIDFSAEVLGTGESETVQHTALIAIIHAVTQFPEIENVAFTVEGATEGVIDGKDVATFWGDVTLHDMPWSMTVGERFEEGSE